jgi:hypothetical protein
MDAPVFVPRDEARAFEDAKVLRHGRKGNVVRRGERADRGFAVCELRENSTPRRVRKRGKCGVKRRE